MAFDREELLEKLAMALVANPGSTMKELADSAGISKASLHRIYSTKEKLQTIIIERMQGVFAEIRQSIQKPHEDYMEALRELIHIHCRNSTYILFIGRDDFFDMLKDEEWDDYYNDLEAFFREGQEQGLLHLSTKIGHKTKKIRHKKRIVVQDSSTFLTSFKLVRQTMPSIMQMRSADGRVTFPILLRRQVA